VSSEINENVVTIKNYADEVQRVAHETNASTQELSRLSVELKELTGKFRV